jgi:hypothetical protein
MSKWDFFNFIMRSLKNIVQINYLGIHPTPLKGSLAGIA